MLISAKSSPPFHALAPPSAAGVLAIGGNNQLTVYSTLTGGTLRKVRAEQLRTPLSVLQDLRALVETVQELEQMKTSLSQEFDKLVTTVNTFSVFVNENVRSLKSAVETHAKNNETRMETLKTKNNEIKESEKNFKSMCSGSVKNRLI